MSGIPHNHWDGINHPYGMLEKHYNENGWNLVKENKISVWGSFQPVEVQENIDWDLNPLDNDTWSFYYNGLNWLYSHLWGIDNMNQSPERMFEIISQYSDHINSDNPNKMVWFDHATSDRLSIFTVISMHPCIKIASSKFQLKMKALIFQHIDKIIQFKNSKNWIDSNHGIFHALSLMNASKLDFVAKIKPATEQEGVSYLSETLLSILSLKEHFSLEQSTYYHQLAISLLESLDSNNLKSIGIEKDSFIEKMIDANYWITNTSRKLIALGDTSAVSNIPKEFAYKSIPNKMAKTFTETGFSIVKYNSNKGWNHFSFLHRNKRAPHGHFDALSITLSKGDKEFIIDSGGPYRYGNQLRFKYFMSTYAHNVVIIDGKKHESGAKLIDSRLISNGVFIVEAEHSGYFPVKHTRKCVYVKNKGLAVIDYFSNIDSPRNIELLWHLHPDCTISDDFSLITNQEEKLSMRRSISTNKKIISGIDGDNPQGWITPGIGVKEPCPTIIESLDVEADTKMVTYFEYEKGFFDSFEHIEEIGDWNVSFDEVEAKEFGFNADTISKYISNDLLFWKPGTYFEDRNIFKISKSQRKISHLKLSLSEKSGVMQKIIENRVNQKTPTIYIISNGGSGCHYLGGLISMKDNFKLIDEVYFPPVIINEMERLELASANCLVEMVNLVHLADLENQHLVPINTMHLRRDTPLSKIKRFSVNPLFIFLIRNPIDIAISRGLRKAEYKKQNLENRDLEDDDYLKKQAVFTKNHFSRLFSESNDVGALTIRYEDLTENPVRTMKNIFEYFQYPESEEEIEAMIAEYESAKDISKNKNKSAKPYLTKKQKKILVETLADSCKNLGYEIPDYVKL